MVSHSVIDRFHSELMDNDLFNEAMMSSALKVVQYYAGPGVKLTDEDYELAMELCTHVTMA